ncbi:MAG: hypothetical protein ACYDHH_23835 [Solirubrobacteraceae bacterium]
MGIPNLTLSQVREAIERLEEHGLVAASARSATFGYQGWYRLRPTADGLRVFGEWPPAESASVDAALVHVLAGNDDFQDEDRSAARRAAGTVANLFGDVVLDVLKNEVSRLAGGGAT